MTCSWGMSDHSPRHSRCRCQILHHPPCYQGQNAFVLASASHHTFSRVSSEHSSFCIDFHTHGRTSHQLTHEHFLCERPAKLFYWKLYCIPDKFRLHLLREHFSHNLVLWLFAAKFTDNNLNGVHKLIVSVKLLFRGKIFFAFLTMKLSIMFLLAFFLFYIWLFQDVSLVFLFWCSGCNHLTCSVLCVSKLVLNIYHGEKWILLLCLNHCSLCKIFIWILFWLVVWTPV